MAAAATSISLETPKRDAEELVACLEDPDVAFQLFLSQVPSIFSEAFGFLTLPLVGNYSEDYSPAAPMALLSLPLISAEAQLPPSVAEMVEVLFAQKLIDSLPIYVMMHSALLGPQRGQECGYLTCRRTDEFNLLLHPWLFSLDHVHESEAIAGKCHVGVFEPYGVEEAHVDRGGVPFGLLSVRPQIIHDFRFSPNNLSIRWQSEVTDTPVFFSIAVDKRTRRGIVCLHILPVGDDAADRIRGWMKSRVTLRDLLQGLKENLPGKRGYDPVAKLLAPLVSRAEWAAFDATAASGAGMH